MRINYTGPAYRHTPERVGPLDDLGIPAPNPGRYHRCREPRPLYCSSTREAAWKEAERRLGNDLVRLVGHRMSLLTIREAPLLDLTDPDFLDQLSLTREDLIADDLALTQPLADRARDEGLAGLQAPSAGDPEDLAALTIVVFPDHLVHVRVDDESVEPFPEG